MGPMGNAIRAVPSHPIPWDISHGIPMGIPFPWTSLQIKVFQDFMTKQTRTSNFLMRSGVAKQR